MGFKWLIFLIIWNLTSTEDCDKQFSNGTSPEHISLNTIIGSRASASFVVKGPPGVIITVVLADGVVIKEEKLDYVLPTGNYLIGDFSFNLTNVTHATAGMYNLSDGSANVYSCKILYIIGKPEVPVIKNGADPEAGSSIVFECSSRSETFPKDHGLEMNYTWTIGEAVNPTDSRFAYSATRSQLTISPVNKADQNTEVYCTAKEMVTGGQTSDMSSPVSINVLFGPENERFEPSSTNITHEEGYVLNTVVCLAECNPNCSFLWTKDEKHHTDGASLSLGSLNSSDAGEYSCVVTRRWLSKTTFLTLTVNVIYGPRQIIMFPERSLYEENENASLSVHCSSACYPPCTYAWKKVGSDSIFSFVQALEIASLKRDDKGDYICTVRNEGLAMPNQHQVNRTIKIAIRYGPDLVSFDPEGLSHIGNETETFSITCDSSCYPGCSYKWKKGGHLVKSDATLQFIKLNRTDAGTYTCTVQNTYIGVFDEKTRSVDLKVRYGPDRAIVSPADTLYTENTGSTFHDINCTSKCYPTCSYNWKKQSSASQPIANNGLLKLGVLRKEDAGKYVCTVNNLQLSKSKSVQIVMHIRYGPDNIVIMPDGPFTVEEGHKIPDFNCSSECFPGCSHMWNSVPGAVEIKGNVLILGSALRNYTGEYKCTSTNKADEYSKTYVKSINITVQYHPDVKISQINGTDITEGSENIILLCYAKGEPTNYTFTKWIHYAPDGFTQIRELSPSWVDQDRVYLKFQVASYMDSGSYQCNVTNGVPKYGTYEMFAHATVTQEIKGRPVINDEKKDVVSALHENALLSVTFYSNDGSTPTVNWYRTENETLRNEDNRMSFARSDENVSVDFHSVNVVLPGYKIELLIQNISQSDLGVYNVSVSNSVGTSVLTINLHAQGVPEPPEEFAINSVTLSSVVLTWRCGFHSGANQTFFIQSNTTSSPWQTSAFVDGGQLENTDFNVTIDELSAETQYSFRIFAANIYGNSSFSKDTLTIKTDTLATEKPESSNDGLIGAAVGSGIGGAVVIIGIAVLIIIWRRKVSKERPSAGTQKKTLLNGNERLGNEDELAEVQNPVYESADPTPSTLQATYVYSQVSKPKEKLSNNETTETNDLYAQVQKPQKMDISANKSVPSADIYSVPIKEKGKQKKEKKGKEKPEKKSKQEKNKGGFNGKNDEGMVYENSETLKSTTDSLEHAYGLTDDSSKISRPTRTQNQDGLIYVQVDLPPVKDSTDRKAIIHGIDDRSEYADIAFGKVGELAPESDEDEIKNGNKAEI